MAAKLCNVAFSINVNLIFSTAIKLIICHLKSFKQSFVTANSSRVQHQMLMAIVDYYTSQLDIWYQFYSKNYHINNTK